MIFDRILAILTNVSNVFHVLEGFQQGSIVLQTGKHAVEIETRKCPIELWVSLKDAGCMAVCGGDLDKVSYTLTPTGFVLYAEVVSDYLHLDFLAVFN